MMSAWYSSNRNLNEQTETLSKASKELTDAKDKQTAVINQLESLESEMKRMETQLKEKKAKLNELEEDLFTKKANIAITEKLVTGLGDEKISWNNEKNQLGIMYEKLIGDAMLSCAFLT